MYANIGHIDLQYVGVDGRLRIDDLAALSTFGNLAHHIRIACLQAVSLGELWDVEITYDFNWGFEEEYLDPVMQIFGDHSGCESFSLMGPEVLALGGVMRSEREYDRLLEINKEAEECLSLRRRDIRRQGIPCADEEIRREVSVQMMERIMELYEEKEEGVEEGGIS